MEQYQERVIAERDELQERLNKLTLFLSSDDFKSLLDIEAVDLYRQAAAMSDYLLVLNRRISRFK